MSLCRHCLRQAAPALTRSVVRSVGPVGARSYSRSTVAQAGKDTSEELEKVKARAWYLDPSPADASTSTSTESHSSSQSSDTATISTPRRQPRFTTFDPESTRSDNLDTQRTIIPLPENATSPILVQLHRHLTAQSDSVDPTTVRFLHPATSRILTEQSGTTEEGEGVGYGSLLGESGGTGWEWVVVCQVKGRGRGVINRAEKEIRKWVCPSIHIISNPKPSAAVALQTKGFAWMTGVGNVELTIVDEGGTRKANQVENSFEGRGGYGLGNDTCWRGGLCQLVHRRGEGAVESRGALGLTSWS